MGVRYWGAYSMQGHASRHESSEFLKDRHPLVGGFFPAKPIPGEIADAYGRRAVPKLVEALRQEGLPTGDVCLALRVLLGQMSDQEKKGQAVAHGVCAVLAQLLGHKELDVRELSCELLGNLAGYLSGREAIAKAGAVGTLVGALEGTAEAAAKCLWAIAKAKDGSEALLRSQANVVPSLVQLLARAGEEAGDAACPEAAQSMAVATIAGMCSFEEGIVAALESQAIAAVLAVGGRRGAGGGLQRASARFVMQMCHHPHGKIQVLEGGGIACLERLLRGEEEYARLAAAGLMGLATEADAKVPIAEVCLPALLAHLSSKDINTAENAQGSDPERQCAQGRQASGTGRPLSGGGPRVRARVTWARVPPLQGVNECNRKNRAPLSTAVGEEQVRETCVCGR